MNVMQIYIMQYSYKQYFPCEEKHKMYNFLSVHPICVKWFPENVNLQHWYSN
jgi:hypothetical protein